MKTFRPSWLNRKMYLCKKNFLTLLLLPVAFIAAFPDVSFCAQEDKKIVVIFRFDDVSGRSDTDIESKILEQFIGRNFPVTFAVIPYVPEKEMRFTGQPAAKIAAIPYIAADGGRKSPPVSPGYIVPLTANKAELLKKGMESGLLEIALHGYAHQRNGMFGKSYNTEFRGVDFDTQKQMISQGKNLLEEMLEKRITLFAPPWNDYDLNTIRALEDLGFECLSADLPGDVEPSVQLKLLPVTCDMKQLEDAVVFARKVRGSQPVIMVLFHSYDFLEVDIAAGKYTIADVAALLDFVASQKDLDVLSIHGAMDAVKDLGPGRYHDNGVYKKILFYTPTRIRLFPGSVYLDSGNAKRHSLYGAVALFLFYASILLASTAITFLSTIAISRKYGRMLPVCKYLGPTVFVIVSLYSFRDFTIGYNGSVAMAGSLGICMGIWIALHKTKSRVQVHDIPFQSGLS